MSKALEWVDGELVIREMTSREMSELTEGVLERARERMICSRFQAKAALLQAGLLDEVEALMASASPLARLAWVDAIEFRRNSPTIIALATGLGLTDAQIDDLFRAAMIITV